MSVSAVALTYSARGKACYSSDSLSGSLSGKPGGQHNDHRRRDALVMEHAGMVRRVALHMADRLEGLVDPDDLMQTGLVGLLEAAERYSPMEGIPFEAYVLPRVRGAMLDSLRKKDWCPRSVRKQARELQSARSALQQQLFRNPTDEELSQVTGFSVAECRKTAMQVDEANVASLDVMIEAGELLLPVESDQAANPVIRQRLKASLVRALKQLPEREQMIMQLYYGEELNQKEIARVLELTEARISQLRSKAVKTLRKKLSEWM